MVYRQTGLASKTKLELDSTEYTVDLLVATSWNSLNKKLADVVCACWNGAQAHSNH